MTDTTQTAVAGAAHLTDVEFSEAVAASSDKPLLVDFYADWCGPCKLAAPIIDKLSTEFKDKMTIAKINTDDFHQVAADNGVMSIPTVITFKGGKELRRQIGFPGEDGYRQMIEEALAE